MIAPIAKPVLIVLLPIVFLIGSVKLIEYSNAPGKSGEIVSDLLSLEIPELNSLIDSESGEATLFFAYHPQCPCTLASARCFERLIAKIPAAPRIILIAYAPEDKDSAWIDTTTTETLSRVQSSKLVIDRGGAICRKLGAFTSGHCFVYDQAGKLIFSGGITPGRGHEGECDSSSAFLKAVATDGSQRFSVWPVYGCPMINEENL